MKQAVREALLASGVTTERLAELEAKYPDRGRRLVLNTDLCPACGERPGRYDYACGACSGVKARSERRFWQYAADREDGYAGRPKMKRPVKKQGLSNVAENREPVILVALPDELPAPRPKERFEFLIAFGRVSLVVVAELEYEAVRVGRDALGVPENGGNGEPICLGATMADHSTPKDFQVD